MMNAFRSNCSILNCLAISLGLLSNTCCHADLFFSVEIVGEVEFNQINSGPLADVAVGETVFLFTAVDPSNFIDSPNFPTRGYPLSNPLGPYLTLFFEDSGVLVEDQIPANQTPFFVIRNDDPAVDGFFLSTNIDNPFGIPLNQSGQITQFTNDFSVTYSGDTLTSLNVEDAIGEYNFSGLSVFNWTINDGPFNAMGIVFTQMGIGEFFVDSFCEFPLGDTNHDNEVNLLDIGPFVDALLNNTFLCEADVNLDGVVDLLDVAPFVEILVG